MLNCRGPTETEYIRNIEETVQQYYLSLTAKVKHKRNYYLPLSIISVGHYVPVNKAMLLIVSTQGGLGAIPWAKNNSWYCVGCA